MKNKSNVIPLKKLTILFFVSFGLYSLYWCYRNWKDTDRELKRHGMPLLKTFGLFVPILQLVLIYDLIYFIKEMVENKKIKFVGTPGGYLLFLILINVVSLAIPFAFFINLIILIKIQKATNNYWLKTQKKAIPGWNLTVGEIIFSMIGLLVWISILFPLFL